MPLLSFEAMSSTKPHKVFCIGFMKTGTTTLNRALSVLGYRVSHNSWKWLKLIVKNDWSSVRQKMDVWDAVEDNPIPLIYKELDQFYPGSKFILTVRDSEKWYNSVSYHIGDMLSPMHEWLFGKGKGLPKNDKTHTLNVFNTHRKKVEDHFKDRPEDLLIIDVTKIEQAIDGGTPPNGPHIATATVTINLLDENDNIPLFSQDLVETSVKNNVVVSTLISIIIT